MKFPPKLAYVAGPYRSDTVNGIHENIEAARRVAVALWKMGFDVFCPHLNSAMMDGAVPDALFLEFGLRMVPICDCVVVRDEWQKSKGTRKEVTLARKALRPVFMFGWDNLHLIGFSKSITWEQAHASGDDPVRCKGGCEWTGIHGMLVRGESENLNCPACGSWRIEPWRE